MPWLRGAGAFRLPFLIGASASHRLGECMPMYMPITWMSYGLDRSLWGDASGRTDPARGRV